MKESFYRVTSKGKVTTKITVKGTPEKRTTRYEAVLDVYAFNKTDAKEIFKATVEDEPGSYRVTSIEPIENPKFLDLSYKFVI